LTFSTLMIRFVGGDIWLELCTSYSSSCHHHFRHP